jgi:hypothetical protein
MPSTRKTAVRLVKRYLTRQGGPDLGWDFGAHEERLVDEISEALDREGARGRRNARKIAGKGGA